MQDRPDAADLLEAVGDFLKKDILPAVRNDDLLSYKTLVSWNMLGILAREVKVGGRSLAVDINELAALLNRTPPEPSLDYPGAVEQARKMKEELSTEIRKNKAGSPDSPYWQYARESLKRKLEISNPRFSLQD
ncbi:MAG TPA: hypothetical protein DEA96_03620 [Leptospiraceae bacterium]|nr:hypothetical protein [Spirochaetaceae bacterium]HBS04030.1 hypothetical protein [Leptospiraceae bacterium]|tara:strand:+ start:11677 stop:12075 length:399 start_codon:yes stop_codon:yes gene_type:complete